MNLYALFPTHSSNNSIIQKKLHKAGIFVLQFRNAYHWIVWRSAYFCQIWWLSSLTYILQKVSLPFVVVVVDSTVLVDWFEIVTIVKLVRWDNYSEGGIYLPKLPIKCGFIILIGTEYTKET